LQNDHLFEHFGNPAANPAGKQGFHKGKVLKKFYNFIDFYGLWPLSAAPACVIMA
jgi:hypothetical protein